MGSKPRLVIQCDCDNSECCGLEATEKPSKEPPTETPTEPEQAEVAMNVLMLQELLRQLHQLADLWGGIQPDTWWSLFKHCWCRCCSQGEEEGVCGDWQA